MADNFLFTNSASALLAASMGVGDTTASLETGTGALFPSPTGSQKFRAALQDADGNLEIVNCTARSGDNVTVERAQEGTTAQSWTLGVTRFELRLTKETMEEMLQKNGGAMAGDLDMDENNLVDAQINGANTKFTAGQIIGVPLRGAVDDSSNEVVVPNDGTRATAGAQAILTQADLVSNGGLNLLPVGTIVMWFGTLVSLPAGWQLCDGSSGTPDLRGSFPRGAGGAISLGATGGAASASGSTSSDGAHTHGGSTGSTVLTKGQMPAHAHGGSYNTGFERGIAPAVPTGTQRGGVVIPGKTRNDSGTLDTDANSAETTDTDGPLTQETGGGAGHSHTISSDGSHSHTLSGVSTIPPYVGIYFIMKVS